MTYTVFLFNDLPGSKDKTPKYWYKFIDETNAHYLRDNELNDLLKKFNARFYYTGTKPNRGYGNRYLEFATEQDFTMFVLRWS